MTPDQIGFLSGLAGLLGGFLVVLVLVLSLS